MGKYDDMCNPAGEAARETGEAIATIYRTTGASPTVRELADHLGLRSSATVQRRINGAIAAGTVTRTRMDGNRSLLPVTSDGSCPACGRGKG